MSRLKFSQDPGWRHKKRPCLDGQRRFRASIVRMKFQDNVFILRALSGLALAGNFFGCFANGLLIAQIVMVYGFEIGVEFVNQRDPGGDV